ncbi:MAG: phosphomannomutase/phosphoglucomutase [Phycisphaeraceae bacterium]
MMDKIFKAYDIRAVYGDALTEPVAWKVGYAVGSHLKSARGDGAGAVVVSRDMRPSSPSLCDALARGIRAAGPDVIDLGMADTSMMYFAINHLGAMGGVQTTASHNPIEYNGFKISREQARPVGADTGLREIQEIAEGLDSAEKPAVGGYEQRDLWDAYRKHIRGFLTPLKRPMRLVIDASNGMAGAMIPRVFDDVENLEIIALNFEITGTFVHEPNPLVPENMVPTQQAVREHGAALGACFDGDADRCIIVDDRGETIGCDHLTALLAEHFTALDQTNPATHGKPTIVYDLRSSKVVKETVEALDATPMRSRVGHVFMKAAMRDAGAVFGGELSGHFYFRGNYYTDSGAIALASVLSVLGQQQAGLSEVIAPLRKYPQSGEINFRVEDKAGVMAGLKARYGSRADVDELDGVTIDAFDAEGWWFNVRPSNTEPLLRLNAEARDQAKLDALMAELTPQIGEPAVGH